MLSALQASQPRCWLWALLVQGSAQAAGRSCVRSSVVPLDFLQVFGVLQTVHGVTGSISCIC